MPIGDKRHNATTVISHVDRSSSWLPVIYSTPLVYVNAAYLGFKGVRVKIGGFQVRGVVQFQGSHQASFCTLLGMLMRMSK